MSGLWNCLAKRRHIGVGGFSGNAFGPYRRRRASASSFPCRRGEIESIFSLLSLTYTQRVLICLEIGAKYEKDREFLNAASRLSSIPSLYGQPFQSPGGIDGVGRICGWSSLVLLSEIEHRRDFGRIADRRNDSLHRNFARAPAKARRGRQTSHCQRRYSPAGERTKTGRTPAQ